MWRMTGAASVAAACVQGGCEDGGGFTPEQLKYFTPEQLEEMQCASKPARLPTWSALRRVQAAKFLVRTNGRRLRPCTCLDGWL